MRGSTCLVLSLGLLLCARPSPAAGQAAPPPSSAILAEIHATGSHRYSEAQVVAASGLHPGETLTREQIEDAAGRLLHSGDFLSVRYNFASRGDQLSLEFALQDAPTVPVSFDNFPWFKDSEVASAIRGMEPLFDGTVPKQGAETEQIAALLARMLQQRGLSGVVSHRLVAAPLANQGATRDTPGMAPGDAIRGYRDVLPADSSDAANPSAAPAGETPAPSTEEPMVMRFYLQGPSVIVAGVEYGDDLARNSTGLKERVQDLIGKPYSRLAIELFEDEQVRPLYFLNGQLRVKFGEPLVRFVSEENQAQPTAPGASAKASYQSVVSVTLPIEPGPVFHLASVAWSGNRVLEDADLSAQLVLKPGDLADGMKLEAGWQAIENAYAHRGYLDARLDPQPRFDDAAARVSYNIAVTEGPQYRMGDLVITGLSVLSEKVLRAVWRLAPGDVFDGVYFDDMLAQLAKPNPAVFGEMPLHYTELGHWLRPRPGTHAMDVLLDFK